MSTELETKLLATLDDIRTELAELRKAKQGDHWPKTPAQFAALVGREPRTVQEWIDRGLLKANTRVRPALITKANAERFLEGSR